MVKFSWQRGVCGLVAGVACFYASGVMAQPAKSDVVSSVKPTSPQVFSCPDLQNKEKMTIDPMIQGLDGWFFRLTSDFQENFGVMQEGADNMARLSKALKDRGTSLVFISVPSRGMVASPWMDKSEVTQGHFAYDAAKESYYSRLDSLRKAHVIAPDMLKSTVGGASADVDKFFFKRDHHWTPLGARLAAQAVGEALKQDESYKSQQPKKYVTKEISKAEMKHTMAMEIQRLCQGSIPAEPYPVFETSLEANDEEALFGDDSAQSVLVGSSYSATKNFNFDGFLMESTGLNIANYAISGGMLFNALISLTNNPQFETMKPPYIFWEAPTVYDLNTNTTSAFRQIIPALHGACGDDKAIVVGDVDLSKAKGGVLLEVPADKKIHGHGYYLVLDASSRALNKFTLEMDYDDEDGEWFLVDRTLYFDNAGRFFVELSDEIDSNLVKVSIDTSGNTKASMKAKLCAVPVPSVSTTLKP